MEKNMDKNKIVKINAVSAKGQRDGANSEKNLNNCPKLRLNCPVTSPDATSAIFLISVDRAKKKEGISANGNTNIKFLKMYLKVNPE